MSIEGLLAATSTWSVSLAPDGRKLAYVSDRDGRPRLTLLDLDDATERTLDTGPDPVYEARYSHDGSWLAYATAPGGSPRTQVHVVRADGRRTQRLGGSDEGASYLGPWTHHPSVVALSHTTSPPGGVCELLDVATGERRVVTEGGLPLVLDVDRSLARVLVRRGPRGRRSIWVIDLERRTETQLFVSGEPDSADLGRLSPDGRRAYLRSAAARDTFALFEVELDDEALPSRLIADRVGAELEHSILTSDGSTMALLWNRAGQSECELLDLANGNTRQLLLPEPFAHGGSFSHDGRVLALTLEGPTHPRAVHLLDIESGSWERVTPQPSAFTQPKATPELVKLQSQGGIELSGWLYRAPAANKNGLRAAFIHLHGGPEAQERPGYNPLFQALVERGISVFAPNVRGSSGFGRMFMEADNLDLRWGAIADVACCARFLLDRGLATPPTLGCGGRSYGGYLTLAALVFHPELFAAGLDVCGMSDLRTFYRDTEPWIAVAAYPKYGHPVDDAELLRLLSPLEHFERLRAPLLVVHGENDTNVPLGEARQAVDAARRRGISAELLLFAGEGHELARRENRETFVRRSVEFLEQHLLREHRPATAQPLLGSDEPAPYTVSEGLAGSPFLFTCDHAGRRIPASLGSLGLADSELERHIAWDLGAAELAHLLARELGGFLITQTYSRLVIDCNRPLDVPSSIPELSEATPIPANRGLAREDAERRAAAIFQPYHARIDRELTLRQARGVPTVYVAVHSFTPRYLNVDRPMHAGVLYGSDSRFAKRVLERLRADGRFIIGENEPYRVSAVTDYGVIQHAERRNLLYVELEIRQDLLVDDAGRQIWAKLLANALLDAAGMISR